MISRRLEPPLSLALILAFLVVAIAGALLFQWEHSQFLRVTAPTRLGVETNNLWGYAGLVDNRPQQLENIYFIEHMLMFSGGPVTQDNYTIRPVYAFLASALVPLVGWIPALIAVNVAAWVVAVLVSYRFALRATGDRRAASWAAALTVAGTGFVLHVHDYSAHLLAFTVYYLVVLVLFESEVWRKERPAAVHAALAIVLAAAALQYNTGLMLMVAYAAMSLRHNRLIVIVLACAFVYLVPKAWPVLLNLWSGFGVDYGAVERLYLMTSLERWLGRLQNPLLAVLVYLRTFANYVFYEAPHVTLLGIAGCILLVRRTQNLDLGIFIASCTLLPLFAIVAYIGPGLATGYIAFGTSIFVYLGCGALLASLGKRHPAVALASGLAILAGQLAWNYAFALGMPAPGSIFLLGIATYFSEWLGHLALQPTFLSLTSGETVPALGDAYRALGGADCTDLAMRVPPALERARPGAAVINAIALRLPFALVVLAAVGAALCVLGRRNLTSRPLIAFGAAVGLALLVPAALANVPLRGSSYPSLCYTLQWRAAHDNYAYGVDVPPAVVAALEALPAEIRTLEVFNGFGTAFGNAPRGSLTVTTGDFVLQLDPAARFVDVDRRRLVEGLRASGRLVVEAAGIPADALVIGWQRNGVPGRRLASGGTTLEPAQQPVLPAIEIRARLPGELRLLLLGGF